VILISALFATFRGLVQETFKIIDWLLAGYAALRFTPLLLPYARPYLPFVWLQWVVVGLATFLVLFIPLSIATRRIAQFVQKSQIGAVDRLMGFVFGAGRGLVIVSLAYLAFASLVPEQDRPDSLIKARLYPVIRDTSNVLRALIPRKSDPKARETASAAVWVHTDARGHAGGLTKREEI
jgi:membrane protein required for colicin V production